MEKRIRISLTLKRDLVQSFRRKGFTNLSAVVEVLLSAFLERYPDSTYRYSTKETLEIVSRYLLGHNHWEHPVEQEEEEQRLEQEQVVEEKFEQVVEEKEDRKGKLTAKEALQFVKQWAMEMGADPSALGID